MLVGEKLNVAIIVSSTPNKMENWKNEKKKGILGLRIVEYCTYLVKISDPVFAH